MTTSVNEPELESGDQIWRPVDPSGDLLRDHAEYEGLSLGADDDEDQDMPVDGDIEEEESEPTASDAQDEEDTELDEVLLAEEHWLEPERPTEWPDAFEQESEDSDAPSEQTQAQPGAPLRLQGGFERPLANIPDIVEFSDQNAGTVYERTQQFGNHTYRRAIRGMDGPNQYAPFSSKMDWEVAHWAKMRGPSSNALTELLRIEGVRLPAVNSVIILDSPI
jgi:hypothetical protein